MTDSAPASGPQQDLADHFTDLAARQDAAVERLTHAVARVMAEVSRADEASRAAQVESIQVSVARIVHEAVTNGSRHEVEARAADTEALRERVGTELVVTLGALEESLRASINAVHASVEASAQRLVETSQSEAVARQAGFAAVQGQVDDLAKATRSIAAAQAELHRMVSQLWGGEAS